MGVLNLTPDSFSDGGQLDSVDAAVARAHALVDAGAKILDIGGESTRPGAEPVDATTELNRVVPTIAALKKSGIVARISIDTAKAEVAEQALAAGAEIINDVTALGDPEMAAVAASHRAVLILMHMLGVPRTMQQGPIVYGDVVGEVSAFLRERIELAIRAGNAREQIWIDPGIGFGKTVEHNLQLTRAIPRLAELGQTVVYGPSRKRFLGEITGRDAHDRDRATAAACALATYLGAGVLRVHDVAAVRDAVALAARLRETRC